MLSIAQDDVDEFDKEKNIAEIIGFYANPKFMAAIRDQEKRTRKDPAFQEKVRRAIAGDIIPIK